MEILPVTNKRTRQQFIELPFRLYRGDENWVPPLRIAVRDLLDTAKHFVIKPFLKLLRGAQDRVRVSVFGFQVGDDIGIFFLAKPGVVIDAAVAVQNMLYGFAPRYRRLGDGV